MPSRTLEARVRHHRPRIAVIELHGEINGFAEAALNEAYAKATDQQVETILLNFADVDYINSNGIALIVGLLAKARASHTRLLASGLSEHYIEIASHTRLLASGLSEHYIEIFTITRLADFMTIFPDEASAIQSDNASSAREPQDAGDSGR